MLQPTAGPIVLVFVHWMASLAGSAKLPLNPTQLGPPLAELTAAMKPNVVPASDIGPPAQNWVNTNFPDPGVVATFVVAPALTLVLALKIVPRSGRVWARRFAAEPSVRAVATITRQTRNLMTAPPSMPTRVCPCILRGLRQHHR
jgi:hypothetical protein